MRPILIELPSKGLAVFALVMALAVLAWNLWKKRRGRISTPLWLVAAAWALMGLRGGSWVPSAAVFKEEWVALPIFSYGVMLGTSLVVGWYLVMKLAKQDGITADQAGAIYMWTAIWAMVGARILYVLTNLNDFTGLADALSLHKGGMVAYGGMIGGFCASWYGCRRRRIPLLQWADVSAPAVVLGTGITRLGCLLYGCDFGRPSDVPWALAFPNGSAAWDRHIRLGLITPDAAASLPVHPTQIYESLVGFALFGLLMWLRKRRTFSGQVFLGWVLGYGTLRPLLELLRDDDQRGNVGPLSTSQFIGVVSVVLGLGLAVWLYQQHKRDPESRRYWQRPAARAGSSAAH
ncbi:MAG: prolipoprotein diacylglyceryl transferase [Deltaproteobacteria bacterium]|nr:prolipoprotein diacylglyceryl transferase [Deltaproteobacteria bacterium]